MCLPLFGKCDLYVITLPKSGTHLIKKFLYLLPRSIDSDTRESYERVKRKVIHATDGYLKKERKRYQGTKVLLMIRDLRDIFVSEVIFRNRIPPLGLSKELYAEWKPLSFEEKLSLLTFPKSPFIGTCLYSHTGKKVYENMLELMALEDVFVCRFENLIGLKGGGTRKAQEKEIIDMAKFLGVSLPDKSVKYIADNLFGNVVKKSKTFNKGKIGSWKMHFNEQHIAEFKENFNEYLVVFGYEKDDNWN